MRGQIFILTNPKSNRVRVYEDAADAVAFINATPSVEMLKGEKANTSKLLRRGISFSDGEWTIVPGMLITKGRLQ